MAYLIDTDVVSETFKPGPERRVVGWIGGQMAKDLFLATIGVGDLVRGARRAKEGARREHLRTLERPRTGGTV